MIVLGIETSCDETSAAVVTDDRRILSHEILSQQAHKDFGGVVPEVAARAHLDHIDDIVEKAMAGAGIGFSGLDGIAVTAGPGLIGGVLVGVMTAKAIAAVHKKPIIAVNHLEGHALTARLTDNVAFPYLLLLVSGGHCQILIVEGVGQYKKLGGTIDDAAGEAFDKTAKMIGLGYPGGPAIEKNADMTKANVYSLPRPLTNRPGCDFSFSGLKTAVRTLVENEGKKLDRAALCATFQKTVGDILCDRIENAAKTAVGAGCQTLVVAGGVAANLYLRARLEETVKKFGMTLAAPPVKLCSDNAAMIAWAGIERLRLGLADNADFTPRPRWPLEELRR